jgi:ketol-acid reductoisomerase
VLQDIQSGKFANEWMAENDEGRTRFRKMREAADHHMIEDVGEQLRGMMPWLKARTVPESGS